MYENGDGTGAGSTGQMLPSSRAVAPAESFLTDEDDDSDEDEVMDKGNAEFQHQHAIMLQQPRYMPAVPSLIDMRAQPDISQHPSAWPLHSGDANSMPSSLFVGNSTANSPGSGSPHGACNQLAASLYSGQHQQPGMQATSLPMQIPAPTMGLRAVQPRIAHSVSSGPSSSQTSTPCGNPSSERQPGGLLADSSVTGHTNQASAPSATHDRQHGSPLLTPAAERGYSMSSQSTQSASLAAVYGELLERSAHALRVAGAHAGELPPDDDDDARRRAKQRTVVLREREHVKQQQLAAAQSAQGGSGSTGAASCLAGSFGHAATAACLDVAQKQAKAQGLDVGAPTVGVSGLLQHSNPTIQALGQMSQWITGAHAAELPPEEVHARHPARQSSRSSIGNITVNRAATSEAAQQVQDRSMHLKQQARTSSNASKLVETPHSVTLPSPQTSLPEPATQATGTVTGAGSGRISLSKASSLNREQPATGSTGSVSSLPSSKPMPVGSTHMKAASLTVVRPENVAPLCDLASAGGVGAGTPFAPAAGAAMDVPTTTDTLVSPATLQPAIESDTSHKNPFDSHVQAVSTGLGSDYEKATQPNGKLPVAAAAATEQGVKDEQQQQQQQQRETLDDESEVLRGQAYLDDTGDHGRFNWDEQNPNNSARFSVDVAEQLDALGLFAGADEDDDEDRQHDFEKVFSRRTRWYKMRYWRIYMGVQAVSLVLLIVGVVLQSQVDNVRDQTTESFRWFYFFAGSPLIWLVMDIMLHYVFRWLEWFFFRESLLYLKNVQRNTVTFLFTILLLPWYMAIFEWLWCADGRCEVAAYSVAVGTMWHMLLCVMLFTLANLIKAVVAKLLSTHFYRSAHFQKLNAALEKEVFLQALSRPKRKVVQQREQRELQQEAANLRHSSKISSFGKLFSLHSSAGTSGVQGTLEGGTGSSRLDEQSTRSTRGWGSASLAREPAPSIHYASGQDVQDAQGSACLDVSTGEQVRLANSRHMQSFTAGVTNQQNGMVAKAYDLARKSWGSVEAPRNSGPNELARSSLSDLRKSSGVARGAHDAARLYAGANKAPSVPVVSDPHKQVEANLIEASQRIMGASLAHHTPPQDVQIIHTWAPYVHPQDVVVQLQASDDPNRPVTLQIDAAGVDNHGQPAAAGNMASPAGQAGRQLGLHSFSGSTTSTMYSMQAYSVMGPAVTYVTSPGSSACGAAAMPPGPHASQLLPGSTHAHVPRAASPASTVRTSSPSERRVSAGGSNRVAPLPPRHTKSLGGRAPMQHLDNERASDPLRLSPQLAHSMQHPGVHVTATNSSDNSKSEQASMPPTQLQTSSNHGKRTGVGFGSVPPAPPVTAPLPPPPVPLPWPLSNQRLSSEHAVVHNVTGPVASNAQSAADATATSQPDAQHTITALHGNTADPSSSEGVLVTEQDGGKPGSQPAARRQRFEADHQLPPIEEGPGSRGASVTGKGLANATHLQHMRSASIRATSKGGESVMVKEGRSKAGIATSVASDRARRAPSFTQALGPMAADIIQAVPTQNANMKDITQMTEAELEKVRTAVVIKTYAAIVRNYSRLSPEDMEREMTAIKAFSRALFHNIKGEAPRSHLTMDDFCTFFDSPDHAAHAFAVFDTDGDGHVSKKEVREAIEAIFRERANMADSLRDTDAIVQSLEWAVGAIVHFLFLAFYLLIFGVDIVQGFSTFSATLLAFTFIFGNAVKNMFEALLFLFVTHPFDVGDNVNIQGDVYRVKKITLLVTEMVCINGERMFFPNTDLITKSIINLTRSTTKTEFVQVQVDVGVPPDVVADIMAAMAELCQASPTEYDGLPFVQYRDLAPPMKVVLLVSWTYAFPPDNWKRLVPARNAMFGILQAKLYEHKLRHTVQETELKTVRRLPGVSGATEMALS